MSHSNRQEIESRLKGQSSALIVMVALSILLSACTGVRPGDPPSVALMKADGLEIEGNTHRFVEYDAALREIFLRTTTHALDPDASANEGPRIVKLIVKTRAALRKRGLNISTLELSQRFLSKMPSDKTTYDLQAVRKAVLRSFQASAH